MESYGKNLIRMHVCVCVCVKRQWGVFFKSFFTLLFETGSLRTLLELTNLAKLADQQFTGFLLSLSLHASITETLLLHQTFYVGSQNLNSGPHGFRKSLWLSESS